MPSLPFLPFLLQTGHAQDLTDHDWCVRMCVTVYCCFIAWCMQRCTQGEGGGRLGGSPPFLYSSMTKSLNSILLRLAEAI